MAKQFFSDADEEAGPSKKRDFDERELYQDEDEDDLDNFVVDDDEGEVPREVMVARKKERKEAVKNMGKAYGMSDRYGVVWGDRSI